MGWAARQGRKGEGCGVGVGSRADYLNHTYLESCRISSETRHRAVTKGEQMLDTHTEITDDF